MNKSYISKLLEIAEKDNRVCHLLMDSGTGYDELFKSNFPNQIYNLGIAEQNAVGVAAGLASTMQIPFLFTSDAFLIYRSYEFIRDDICFQNMNVKIVGMGSGISWSSLGPTHHTTEAISILRALPNIILLNPSTPYQVEKCVEYAYKYQGPVYIRIEMNNEKEFYEVGNDFYSNNFIKKSNDDDILIFSTGSILEEVMSASEMLKNDGIDINIIDSILLKPFDEENVLDKIKNAKIIFTIEEHNVMGGLGSILSDIIVKNELNKKLVKIGLNDTFAVSFGNIKQVRRANNLDCESIYNKIKNILKEDIVSID